MTTPQEPTQMTEREMLELAALAAGIELIGPVEKFIVQFDERHKGGFVVRNERGGDSAWNPLADDGDALRLAVKLRIEVDFFLADVQAKNDHTDPVFELFSEHANPYAATRRAITRAAAEIGRQMKEKQ